MSKLSDEELIDEIRQRFEFNRNALNDMRMLTRKLEEMNHKLQVSERIKGRFLSNIRNEVNNPLSAIMGLASQLSEGGVDAELSGKAAAMIYAEAFNLDFQLQNVFVTAELEAGEAVPDFALVNVSGVISGCIAKLSRRIEEKLIHLDVSLPGEKTFPTDAHKLETMVINLLANAVEFNREGGAVSVSADIQSSHLAIAVADNGPGIAATDLEAIFDRFRQLDVGTTKSHRGHGLGLSICRSLAELLGGTLDVDSRPGAGSRFVAILPRPAIELRDQAPEANLFLFDTPDDLERF